MMLILTRKLGEKIIVGDNEIEFTILGLSSGQVRIGIHAPKNLSVHREEIYKKIKREKSSAGSDNESDAA